MIILNEVCNFTTTAGFERPLKIDIIEIHKDQHDRLQQQQYHIISHSANSLHLAMSFYWPERFTPEPSYHLESLKVAAITQVTYIYSICN